MTALWVMSTIRPFVKLIHLKLALYPAHLSRPANGTPDHVRAAAHFSLSDGLWSGEKSGRRQIEQPHPPSLMWCQHKSVLSPCLWPLAATGEERQDGLRGCSGCKEWCKDTRKRRRKGREGGRRDDRRSRPKAKHLNNNTNKTTRL